MTRSPFTRIFGALFAFWFAFVVAEPVALHACPVHDGGPGAAAAASAGGSHAGHAGHGTMAMPAGEHGAPSHQGAHACNCLGACCAVVPLAAPAAPAVEATLVVASRPGLPDHAYVPVARSLLLPWANGPPRA